MNTPVSGSRVNALSGAGFFSSNSSPVRRASAPNSPGLPAPRMQLVVAPSHEALSRKLARDVAALAVRSIGSRGVFTVALSGGSMPKLLSGLGETAHAATESLSKHCSIAHTSCVTPVHLSAASINDMEWDKWEIFMCDERCVPEDDEQSTIKVC